jgi:hypothetical protein
MRGQSSFGLIDAITPVIEEVRTRSFIRLANLADLSPRPAEPLWRQTPRFETGIFRYRLPRFEKQSPSQQNAARAIRGDRVEGERGA